MTGNAFIFLQYRFPGFSDTFESVWYLSQNPIGAIWLGGNNSLNIFVEVDIANINNMQ